MSGYGFDFGLELGIGEEEPSVDVLLLEDGSDILLESGDSILLEA